MAINCWNLKVMLKRLMRFLFALYLDNKTNFIWYEQLFSHQRISYNKLNSVFKYKKYINDFNIFFVSILFLVLQIQ